MLHLRREHATDTGRAPAERPGATVAAPGLDGPGCSFLQLCRADLAAMAELKGAPFPSLRGAVDVLTLPGTWAVLLFRIASVLHRAGLRPLSRILYFANIMLFGVELHPPAEVGPGLAIPHPVGVGFGSDVRLGRKVRLMAGVRLVGGGLEDPSRDGMPTLGDEVWVFDGAKVLGRAVIGDRARIGTNAVVSRDIPAAAVVVGNPARVERHRDGAAERSV